MFDEESLRKKIRKLDKAVWEERVPGPALEVELNQPHGVYLRNNGEIYISDATNHRILKVIKGN